MKTGLHIKQKIRILLAYYNLLGFKLRKSLLGFDVANQFIQRIDKISLEKILNANGAQIGHNCDIETGLTFHNCDNYKNLIIGNNCHIGKNCFFDLRERIEIQDNVVISMQCTFITHIDMSKSQLSKSYPSNQKGILIKANTYIGVGSTLLMGTEIGEYSFIAANALITNSTEPYTMVGGIPAKVIKKLDIQEG
jgi:acetyltransferase-like isoleucine patch superfamily enzyme